MNDADKILRLAEAMGVKRVGYCLLDHRPCTWLRYVRQHCNIGLPPTECGFSRIGWLDREGKYRPNVNPYEVDADLMWLWRAVVGHGFVLTVNQSSRFLEVLAIFREHRARIINRETGNLNAAVCDAILAAWKAKEEDEDVG